MQYVECDREALHDTACYIRFILLLHSFFVWKIIALNTPDEM
jgi:hypothetical protein